KMTFKQLNDRANQLAHYLKDQCDITPDTLVGLCVERSLEMVIGIMGILKSGGAYVPLGPDYPQARLNYILEDAALDIVLSQTEVQSVLTGFNGTIVNLDGMVKTDNYCCAAYATGNLNAAQIGLTSSNLAYVIYTSGSTGTPKGVMVEHQSVQGLTAEMANWFDDVTRVGWCASYVFDASLQGIVYLISGSTLVIVPDDIKVQPEAMKQYIAVHEIQLLDCTPSLLQFWLDDWTDFTPPHLLVGGESITRSLWAELNRHAEQGVKVYNVYGPTECTVNSTVAKVTGEQVHIGKSLDFAQSFILNGSDLSVVPFGVSGELYIGGDGLARGYLNRPELTAACFIVNPFYDVRNQHSSPRLYKTGDLVRYLPDGNLEFIGRVDDQVKIRGFRVELGEVQVQLAQLEMVDSALIMAQQLTGSLQLVGYIKRQAALGSLVTEGEGETQLVDYVTAVKAALAQQLPEYMVPGIIMVVDEWPLTANGKVDKAALPAPDGSALQGEYVAPETETEQVLADIWSVLLNIAAESVSTTSNFFDLGGHSLLTVKLLSLIQTQLDKACE
ncbi:MAG: non-ribosomal peptide synthetase, partial [Psychrosphaera sp.]|nr:non-ribosomal peptide synthetase [Psychrosphaera sp.]